MSQIAAGRGYRRHVIAWIALVLGAAVGLLASAPAGLWARSGALPQASDVGVLTQWPLPPNRGPWQLKWDDSRNMIWFAEGNHADPLLDRIAGLDPATGLLREWAVITEGGYVHGTGIDRNHDLWFTLVRINKVGRLQPESSTITEWTIDQSATPHGIIVDDITSGSATVWISEREQNVISSLNPATGQYRRHEHPFENAQPHSLFVAPDHSIWFVEVCGNRVGQLVPGDPVVWNFWQPPTPPASCGAPNGIGPLFGSFVNGDFWYSEPYNGNIIRLRPQQNEFSIWQVPGSGNGSKLITQLGGAPNGEIFFPEMNRNRVGRLEPQGPTTPTVVAVTPTTVTRPAPPEATAVAAAAVYTPIVTQLTPVTAVLTGTRTGSIVEWVLPTVSVPAGTPTPGRNIGPGRAWYGGGGYWASLVTANQVVRFAPYTPVPPTSTPTATPTNTPTLTNTATASATSAAPSPTLTQTPCTISFSDVQPSEYFYEAVRYLTCAGVVSGYSDNTFRPYNNTTRGQMTKIVVLAFGIDLYTPPTPTFSDVPTTHTFYQYVETAAHNGIVSGYSDGTFRPQNDVTRGQLSKIVVEAAQWPLVNPPTPTFSDVPVGSPFYQYIETAFDHQIISGYSDGTFRPGNNATRGQIAKIVHSAVK